MRNTKEKGKFTLFVYQEKPNYYVGVCLEFDIVQEDKSQSEAMQRIKTSSLAYLRTVIRKKYSDDLLNTLAPDEYWKRYYRFLKKKAEAVRRIETSLEKDRPQKLVGWDDFVGNTQSAQDFPYDFRSLINRQTANV